MPDLIGFAVFAAAPGKILDKKARLSDNFQRVAVESRLVGKWTGIVYICRE